VNVRLAQGGGSSFDGAAAPSATPSCPLTPPKVVGASCRQGPGGQLRFLPGLLAVLLLAALFGASAASAAYQQAGLFAGNTTPIEEGEEFPEEVQLGGVNGMTVNYTGAGGVPAGTIYAVTYGGFSGEIVRVSRYNPDRSFSETWGVLTETEEANNGKYQRCGPDGEPARPNCPARSGAIRSAPIDVDVDQSTGNVYVLYRISTGTGGGPLAVTVYTADGSEIITRFAETATFSESIAATPEKIHDMSRGGGMAVDGSGNVYVTDSDFGPFGSHFRLAVFRPQSSGDYEHYVYAGQSQDVAVGSFGKTNVPLQPVADAAGYIYTDNEEVVEKHDPAHPAGPPICSFRFKKSGITSLTVNPLTGEVFFASYQDGKRVHRLSPECNEEGKFTELESFSVTPARELYGLAVDPVGKFDAESPAGILYGGSPGPELTEPGTSAFGYFFVPTKEVPPVVISESVSNVTQTTARLEGRIDPKGIPTRYAFQYIADAAYQANEPGERFAGAGEAPAGGALLEDSEALPVAVSISGLLSDTEYHYRLSAGSHCSSGDKDKVCEAVGPAKAFRTYSVQPPGLPDDRAYELVSPAEKHGGQVLPSEPTISSCPLVECKPGAAYNHDFIRQTSVDGDAIAYEGSPFAFRGGARVENEYLSRRGPSGWQTVNLTPAQLSSKVTGGYEVFDPDLAMGLVHAGPPTLSPQAPGDYPNLYLQPSGNPLALVPLLTEASASLQCPPGGGLAGLSIRFRGASSDLSRLFFEANDALTPEALGGCGEVNLYEWSAGRIHPVNLLPGGAETVPGAKLGGSNAISKDGSRVFWSSPAGQVFVRIGGAETREIEDPGGFLTASTDGSKVLLDNGHLYDLGDEEPMVDLTQGKGGFQRIAGQSDDLSHVYFVDTAVLTGEEENGQGAKAQAGEESLYLWDEGSTTFIATLAGKEEGQRSQASPAGRWLAFLSQAPLTGYDNTGPCGWNAEFEEYIDAACVEVFLFDSSSAKLICASCPATGTPPRGPSVLRSTLPPARYLTDAGRLYFDSQDSLSLSDTNGRAEDVYEFEPGGVGTCERQGGCVSLISAGRGGADSNLLLADASGKNVFFTTRDRLNKPDRDQAYDLYDAREGGIPTTESEVVECQGEACQQPPFVPDDPTPGSSSFRGEGNVGRRGARHCPRGKARRHGKCVKKHQRKPKRHHSHRGAK
jgi:hypothetical protein